GSLPGSTISPPACRPSRPQCRRLGRRLATDEYEKAPGATRGLVACFWCDERSEAKVEPAAHDMSRERGVIAGEGPATKPAIDVAKVDVEIFRLCGPGSEQPDLEPCADGPAEIGVILVDIAWRMRADIADGEATRHIGHEAVEGVTHAAAHGGKPGVAGLAA